LSLAALGCGGSGSDSTATTTAAIGASGASGASGPQGVTTTTASTGKVRVEFAAPQTQSDALGAKLLKVSQTEDLAQTLAQTFQLPHPLLVKGVNGLGSGPFYNPRDNSITLPYGFATLIFNTARQGNPGISGFDLGQHVGAVNSFILEHEFGHALIANFKLPVLGSEEDAADTIATVLLLKAPQGGKYDAFAAQFWADFSGRQNPPAVADYADVHSLDLQRSFDILCDVAGASRSLMQQVASLGALPRSRLVTCPQQYQQAVDSLTQELRPHLAGSISLGR
jgi:hypothetical protein